MESDLAKGSVVIRSHKSDVRVRDHMVGEESDDAVLSAVFKCALLPRRAKSSSSPFSTPPLKL